LNIFLSFVRNRSCDFVGNFKTLSLARLHSVEWQDD
jgi:hypothetical protein